MVGDVFAHGRNRDQLLLAHQTVEQLSVVHDLVVAAHLRVLVAEGVEAVRTGDDDLALLLLDTVEDRIEHLDVLHRELLEQELVAGTTCGVAGAGFVGAEDHELHSRGGEEFGDSLGGLLGTVFVGAGAADPEEVLVVLEAVGVLAEDRDLEVHLVDPVETVLGVLTPGVALVLEVLEQAGELGGELRFDQDLVATHVDDVVDVFDVDGALFDAGTAVGAAPQGFGVDDRGHLTFDGFTDELAVGLETCGLGDGCECGFLDIAFAVDETDLVAAHVLASTSEQVRGLGVAVVTQRHDEQLGRERLSGVPSRALGLATPALGAGGEVQPALPGEVFDVSGAESVGVGVDVLHRQDFALGHHGLCCAERDGAVVFTLEVDVEERREAVPRDAPGDVAAHDREPDHAGHQLHECEHRDHDGAGGKQFRDLHGEEVGPRVGVTVGRDLACLDHDHAQALEQDDAFDDVGSLEVGAAETGQARGQTRVVELTDHDQRGDTDDGAQAEDLVPQVPRPRVTEDGPVEFGVERLAVGLEPQQEPTEEADHDEPVGPADAAELVHARVRDELDDHLLEAREERAPSIGCRLADAHGVEHPQRA